MPVGAYATQQVIPQGTGYISGSVPADYASAVSMSLRLISSADDVAFAALLEGMCGVPGQAYNVNDSGGVAVLWSLVKDVVFVADLLDPALASPLYPALAAGQILGLAITTAPSGAANIDLLGIRLVYRVRSPLQGGLGLIREEFFTCQTWTQMPE